MGVIGLTEPVIRATSLSMLLHCAWIAFDRRCANEALDCS